MKFHELSNIFPPMTERDYQELKADIKANGLKEPIITHEVKIVDGRHRYRACVELEVEPEFREWDGRGSLLEFVLSMNLRRRHLNTSQRAILGAEIRTWFSDEARGRQGMRTDLRANMREGSRGKASEHVARIVNVSSRSIDNATRVKRYGVPELHEAVKDNVLPISLAASIAELSADEQKRIVRLGAKSKIRQVLDQYRRQAREKTRGRIHASQKTVERIMGLLQEAAKILGDRDPELAARMFFQQFPFDEGRNTHRLERNIKGAKLLTEIYTLWTSKIKKTLIS